MVGTKGEARAEFVQKVVATRNYQTHFDENKKDKAARGKEFHHVAQQLKLLLEACLMEEIGFGPGETRDAV